MTAGFGAAQAGSVETRSLRAINSREQSFANKDFVKNVAWLNNSVDTLSSYTQMLQKGVDAANQSVFEQIQGFAADLFVLFAGMEPTGIDIGDLKYVFQGLGALLGVNPDTPFPLNLVTAAGNLFGNWIAPLPQFTDVIFDAMALWAEDLGFTPEVVEALNDLNEALIELNLSITDFFSDLGGLLDIFGTDFPVLGALWDAIKNLFDGLPTISLKPIFEALSYVAVPTIQSLTWAVETIDNLLDPLSAISAGLISGRGSNVLPAVDNRTTQWTVGSNESTLWVFDEAQSTDDGETGSFRTTGNGVAKRVLSQRKYEVVPSKKLWIGGDLRWSGIPSATTGLRIIAVFYFDNTEVQTISIPIPLGHGATGGWVTLEQEITVPYDVNGVRVGASVDTSVTSGQVWVDALQLASIGRIAKDLIDGLIEELMTFLTVNSPLNALNIIGQLPSRLFGRVPVGTMTEETPNLLPVQGFPVGSIAPNDKWLIDPDRSRTEDDTGAAKIIADGTSQVLRSGKDANDTIIVSPGSTFTGKIYVSHEGYVGTGLAIMLQVVPYVDGTPSLPILLDSYTPSSPSIEWPGHLISGEWIVPEGITSIQLRILLTSNVTEGTFYFDDPSTTQFKHLRKEWVLGLPEELQDIVARWQLLVDTAFGALTGTTSLMAGLEDLADALRNIPFLNVIGIGGPANIGGTIEEFLNQLVGGLVGEEGTGASFADVFNINRLVSSWASQGRYALELLGIRNSEPVDHGLLPTGTSNYPYSNANTFVPVTQSESLCVTHRVGKSAPLGVISFIGRTTSGVTAVYVNIRVIDRDTGARELIHHSPNLIGEFNPDHSNTWVFYQLEEPPARIEGEDYEYQLVPVGGTIHILGMDHEDDIPDHPYAQVKSLAAVRNETNPTSPAPVIEKSLVTKSPRVMWVETAIDTGNETNYHDPVTVYLTESGTIGIPNWANFIDPIPLGAGGGGNMGGTLGFYGEPGKPGKFNATTWERNIHFAGNFQTITFNRGNRGDGGSSILDTSGKAGGSSSFSLGAHTITAEGGEGGDGLKIGGGTPIARGPGMFEYKGEKCSGGGDQHNYGGNGAAPGGAGNGGNWISFQSGGRGGHGAGWVRFRQTALPGEHAPSEPPPAPVLTLKSVTDSTITVEIGATEP